MALNKIPQALNTQIKPIRKNFECQGPNQITTISYKEWTIAKDEQTLATQRLVFCCHGLSRNGSDFDLVADALASKNFRVISVDVVGRGESEWLNENNKADYGYPLYISNLSALVASFNATSIDWIGTSMGALIGMMLCPNPTINISKFVINDIGAFIPANAISRLLSYVGKDPEFETFQQFIDYIKVVFAPFGDLTEAQWEHLASSSYKIVKQSDKEIIKLNYDPAIIGPIKTAADINLWPVWNAIPRSIKVLLLRGELSDILLRETVEQMKLSGAEICSFIEFSGVGHAPALLTEAQITPIVNFLTNA
eukprot:TRINITY_DN461_c1_g1_i1.p1 TRINITY_DN461_c1_g1~~TRINITY_DN461_c1_g1_i1.p1  ORF type:complete len:310 (-),score=124.88 TRINITY_DN461_c1_g1_i1:80-1009(-)